MAEDGVSREEHTAVHEEHAAVRGKHTVLSPEQAGLRETVVQLESAVQAALAEADRARALAQQVRHECSYNLAIGGACNHQQG